MDYGLCYFHSSVIKEKFVPVLQTMTQDSDIDVQYFASEALTVVNVSCKHLIDMYMCIGVSARALVLCDTINTTIGIDAKFGIAKESIGIASIGNMSIYVY